MKLLFGLLFLVTSTGWAQNHGNGGDHLEDDLASEKCRTVKDLGQKLVDKFNGYHKVTNKHLKNYREFVDYITVIALKVKFKELDELSEQQLRIKCGDAYINELLQKNPWLKDKEIHNLFAKISNKDAGTQCYGIEVHEVQPYLEFLEIWTKQKSLEMTPAEKHQMNMMDNHLSTSG